MQQLPIFTCFFAIQKTITNVWKNHNEDGFHFLFHECKISKWFWHLSAALKNNTIKTKY